MAPGSDGGSGTALSTPALSAQSADALARGLGWFSIALGLAEVFAPRALARSLGMQGSEPVLALYGAREITNGIGILAARDRAPWLWGRVAGDAIDIATLATGLTGDNPRKGNVGLAIAAVVGVTALDVLCAQALRARQQRPLQRYWAERWAPDYSDRSGFPQPPEAMRGAARDFDVPRDMRIPEPLRPYTAA